MSEGGVCEEARRGGGTTDSWLVKQLQLHPGPMGKDRGAALLTKRTGRQDKDKEGRGDGTAVV